MTNCKSNTQTTTMIMKFLKNTLVVLAIASLVVLVNCKGKKGKDPDPEPQGKATSELLEAGTWVPTTGGVTNNNTPRDEWDGFTLTLTANADFTGGTYAVSGMPSEADAELVWKSNGGTWAFVKNADDSLDLGKVIKDGDADNVLAVTVSATSLRLQFTVPDPAARVDGFDGAWVFNFELQQ